MSARHLFSVQLRALDVAPCANKHPFSPHTATPPLATKQGVVGAAAIRRSIQGMLEELEYNLWEAILVRLVDYGHTVSPELEMAALRWVGRCVVC